MKILVACEFSGRVRDALAAKVHYAAPGPDRWKMRSVTYQGIADVMADQWFDTQPESM